jgi:hypothetical protein
LAWNAAFMTLKGRRKITIGVYRWNDDHGGMRFAFPPYGLRAAERMAQEVGGVFTELSWAKQDRRKHFVGRLIKMLGGMRKLRYHIINILL